MQISLTLLLLFLIVSAVISLARRPLTRNWRLWASVQLLVAGMLFWVLPVLERRIGNEPLKHPKMDRSSVIASFNSISAEGAQRQLVFHYTLENTTNRAVRIDPSACSMVSFRFTQSSHIEPVPNPHPNPALNLLEKDRGAYAKFTGLERLPTTNPALTIDQCPLELAPGQRRSVVIGIPYAYPGSTTQNANDNDLKKYVRTFMPQIDGFGISDLARNYEIDFPRAW